MNTLRIPGGPRVAGILVALLAAAGVAAAGTPPETNLLQDIPVFKDRLLGTWSGGDLVAPGSQVPVDWTQMQDDLPSLRYEIQGPNQWWWVSILAGDNWASYSIEHYRADGFLEFNVKGALGGEKF